MSGERIDVRPIAGALGAEVHGVDLSRPPDDSTLATLRRALHQHLVIFFHDQQLTPEQQKAFARLFGRIDVYHHISARPLAGDTEILEVVTKETDSKVFGGAWHADVTFLERPSLGAVLYAREVPEFGGDTIYSNMYLAYSSLSPGMRALLDGLVAVHGTRVPDQTDPGIVDGSAPNRAARLVEVQAEHPVVRTHPETGRKALFVNRTYTLRFKDMTEEESRPLLSFLFEHATRPEFTCRFRWRPNSLALWDNRCTQHLPVNDYHGRRRVMHRVTIEGDRPC